MNIEAAARAWIDGWARAWPVGDVATVAALYAADAVFFSHPFREPQPAAEYAAWAFAGQSHAECRFGEPIVSGDRAAVNWWAAITAKDESVETVAGTSLLRFAQDGLVVEQHDAWASESGYHELDSWAR